MTTDLVMRVNVRTTATTTRLQRQQQQQRRRQRRNNNNNNSSSKQRHHHHHHHHHQQQQQQQQQRDVSSGCGFVFGYMSSSSKELSQKWRTPAVVCLFTEATEAFHRDSKRLPLSNVNVWVMCRAAQVGSLSQTVRVAGVGR